MKHPVLVALALVVGSGFTVLGLLAWAMHGIARIIEAEERD